MSENNQAPGRRRVRTAILVPSLLLILVGLVMAGVGVAVASRIVWVGLLLVVVGLGGPVFQGVVYIWHGSRSRGK